ncbi:MAG: trehalose-phosphatase [Thermoleophilia bacterium]
MPEIILKGAAKLDELIAAVAVAPQATALFCDVDGTIAPIVADPFAAAVPARTRATLAALATHLGLLAFATGRDLAQSRALVGIDGVAYVGTHGLQIMEPNGVVHSAAAAEAYVDAVHAFVGRAVALATRWPGVVVEDKRTVVAVHYRNTADPATARTAIEDEVAEPARAAGLTVATGHFVVEVRPPLPLNKGTAVVEILNTHAHILTAVFCGDDLTDVTGFEAVHQWAASGVRSSSASPGRRAGYAVAALTSETPAAVKEASDIEVAATPGIFAVLARLLTAAGG